MVIKAINLTHLITSWTVHFGVDSKWRPIEKKDGRGNGGRGQEITTKNVSVMSRQKLNWGVNKQDSNAWYHRTSFIIIPFLAWSCCARLLVNSCFTKHLPDPDLTPKLTFAMSVMVFALSINFRWSILTFRNLMGRKRKRFNNFVNIVKEEEKFMWF